MTGSVEGVIMCTKQKNPQCTSLHCVIHFQQLAMQKLPHRLFHVQDKGVGK
jgi:hypothetical protein